jgi:hypothetical protein
MNFPSVGLIRDFFISTKWLNIVHTTLTTTTQQQSLVQYKIQILINKKAKRCDNALVAWRFFLSLRKEMPYSVDKSIK